MKRMLMLGIASLALVGGMAMADSPAPLSSMQVPHYAMNPWADDGVASSVIITCPTPSITQVSYPIATSGLISFKGSSQQVIDGCYFESVTITGSHGGTYSCYRDGSNNIHDTNLSVSQTVGFSLNADASSNQLSCSIYSPPPSQ
jgi:hypothetical protein